MHNLKTPCINFKGKSLCRGYGVLTVNGKPIRANRLALMLKLGRKIKDGMLACHTCNNTLCVNPEHIYEGTDSDNAFDRSAAGTCAHYGESSPGNKYSQDLIYAIKYSYKAGIRLCEISKKTGIDIRYIFKIVNDEIWRRVLVNENDIQNPIPQEIINRLNKNYKTTSLS